jgi:alpha-D-xyloside xylohydrolase
MGKRCLCLGIVFLLTVELSFAQNIIESGGVVDIEAESFFGILPQSDHSWYLSNSISGYSGTGYMEALPDNGTNITSNVSSTSPQLQYAVTFSSTGSVRYVWVRGYATNPSNDSVHVGINGAASTATNITLVNAYNAWLWTNKTAAGNAATITVNTITNAIISIWMREDGFRIDRLILTSNVNFSATLGNGFHIPNNTELGFTMRNPFSGMTPDVPVTFYTGNQFQGTGNPGNQLQTGSAMFYKHATNTTWSALPMTFYSQNGNNKYYSVTLPGNTFNGGDTVQYYFKIPYDDHLPTFIYGNDSTRFNTEIESVARAGAFSFTYAQSLTPTGPYLSFTNTPTGAEARIYQNSGHIALASGSNVVAFMPPTAVTGSGTVTVGAVLSSTNLINGLQVRQACGATSIVAQMTFPYDGVMRYEVVDWGAQVINSTALTAASDTNEHFYGFGEKFNSFDQAGNKVHMITSDNPAVGTPKGDSSYKVTPWFISTKGYGFHLDDSTESWFDMRNQFSDRFVISNFTASSFSAYVTNALKFNIVYGPKLTDVLTRYTGYTGRPQMSPPWAFAPWMSSDIWHDGGEVRYVITKYRERGIPGSVFVFDSPWETAYNSFAWNMTQFGNGNTYESQFWPGFSSVSDMMTFLRTNGWKVVCWMTPFVNTVGNTGEVPGQLAYSPNYTEGSASNYFVRASPGGSPLSITWWKGTGSPVDFTHPLATQWLQNQLSNLVAQSGGVIGGFKTDDGESGNPPYSYIPKTASYSDGRTGVEMANGYATEYHRAIWNVLGTNGLLFARSGFTGSQAYSGYWAGDNEPNFGQDNGLQSVIVAGQSAAMSGYSTWASDICGYLDSNWSSTPTNLFVRWTQFGAFSPLMQIHRQTGSNRQYPWSFGADALTNYQFYAKLHTALFPYIYSYATQASTSGIPIIRPVVLLNQDDTNVYGLRHTYYFGNELLVAPVITNTATIRQVYLPAGKWYNFFTNSVYTGGQNILWTNANQSLMPVFVREGGIIPMISTNVQTLCEAGYVSNPTIITMTNALEFLVYPTTNSSFAVYDGTSLNVQSNGTVVTATMMSVARPMLMRFLAAQPFGVERDGVPLAKFTNAADFAASSFGWFSDSGGFVNVKFSHVGGTTAIRFGPDSVGDGISDSWRAYYFGSGTTTNDQSCGGCDADGDGQTNAQEYRAGTDPNNSGNLLHVQTIASGPGGLTVAWTTQVGIHYRILWKDDMSGPIPWQTNGTDFVGDGTILSWLDDGSLTETPPASPSASKRFYKVIVP